MELGFVKIHREILENGIFKDAELFKLFIFCILKANYKPEVIKKSGKDVLINRGQFNTTREDLAKELKQNENTIYSRLKRLKKLGYINLETTNRFTIITVINYNKYQNPEPKPNKMAKRKKHFNNKNGSLITNKTNVYSEGTENFQQHFNNKNSSLITENTIFTEEGLKNFNNKQKNKCYKNKAVTLSKNIKNIYKKNNCNNSSSLDDDNSLYRNIAVIVYCKILGVNPDSSHYSFISKILKQERDNLTYLQRALLLCYAIGLVEHLKNEKNFRGVIINRYNETSYMELEKYFDEEPKANKQLLYKFNPEPYL